MLRRRHINADPEGSGLRSAAGAATEPLRDLAGFLEEHVLWRAADLLRGAAEVARWPLERLAWIGEQRLLWPLRERTAGWTPPGRAAGAGALASLAIGAGALGAVLASGGEDGAEPVVAPAPLAAVAPSPPPEPEKPSGPALRGVPPTFDVGDGEEVVKGTKGAVPGAAIRGGDDPETASGDGAGAGASASAKPVPAGPVAMRVARRFAEAFVFYEIGKRPGRVQTVFGETAIPRLAAALAERPPRQPAGADVPQARVLNLVPGPRRGKIYTVSASLLRVGTIGELRLKMQKRQGAWLVTDIRG